MLSRVPSIRGGKPGYRPALSRIGKFYIKKTPAAKQLTSPATRVYALPQLRPVYASGAPQEKVTVAPLWQKGTGGCSGENTFPNRRNPRRRRRMSPGRANDLCKSIGRGSILEDTILEDTWRKQAPSASTAHWPPQSTSPGIAGFLLLLRARRRRATAAIGTARLPTPACVDRRAYDGKPRSLAAPEYKKADTETAEAPTRLAFSRTRPSIGSASPDTLH